MDRSCDASGRGCCGAGAPFDGASPVYRRVLASVIALNSLGLAVVALGALQQGSLSLAAIALDFLGDAMTYAISLWAIGRTAQVRAGAALVKGASLVALAVCVLGLAMVRAVSGTLPSGEVISGLGLFGAAVNLVAALLLIPFRDGDANVRSVWLCTRNDLIHCAAVAAAGGLVWLTRSPWPDLVAGAALATIFLQSAWSIARQAHRELRAAATLQFVTRG